MRPKSIRWQLPISYAAIALLSTLALGGILLVTLRGHFLQQELDYLDQNADAINATMAQMIEDDVPLEVMRAQIASYSFLSQVRIRILDEQGGMLIDSGIPNGRNLLSISAQPQVEPNPAVSSEPPSASTNRDPFLEYLSPDDYIDFRTFRTSIEMPLNIFVDLDDATREYYTPMITLDFQRFYPEGEAPPANSAIPPTTPIDSDEFTNVLSTTGTVFGFGLGDDIDGSGGRSTETVKQTLVNSQDTFLGTLVLSDGPASGRLIVQGVANGLALASLLAVAVGAIAGWTVSRRITVPLTSLIETTTLMADGELSARSNLQRKDELGLLAQTYNLMASRVETTIVTLKRFVADAAHEFHTPLTALRTSLELMIDETDSKTRDTYLKRAQRQIQRLQNLTDNLLDLSRIESGVSHIQYRMIRLNALLRELSEIYASRSEYAGINFELDIPNIPIHIYGNSGQLRRAIGNLLDNAIKFSPKGGTVKLIALYTHQGVFIHVIDGGIGIEDQDVSLIFSRFHRGRNTASIVGSGLGLAIVKGITESHGGQITVERLSRGTKFTLELPHAEMAKRVIEQPISPDEHKQQLHYRMK